MALPQVSTNAVQELKKAQSTIQSLEEYQKKNWAIGLNGDTFEPDGFLTYFTNRALNFQYYVQNKGVSIGTSQAYSENINTINGYVQNIVDTEVSACEKTISELQTYEKNFWAIGLNGDNLQPDGFNPFFASRELTFKPFVRSKGVSIGEESAYSENINTLNQYISELKKYSVAASV